MFNQKQLQGKKIAILATDGFEQSELFDPKKTLEHEGALVEIISLKAGKIKSWNKTDWGKSIDVDLIVGDAHEQNYDALVLPGGVMNPDKLRIDEGAVEFARQFVESGKPIAAICHGPWLLIETDVMRGRTVTSWPSIKSDLTNAGARWVDQEVVWDENLITSRKPADIPAFCKALIEAVANGDESGPSLSKNKKQADKEYWDFN